MDYTGTYHTTEGTAIPGLVCTFAVAYASAQYQVRTKYLVCPFQHSTMQIDITAQVQQPEHPAYARADARLPCVVSQTTQRFLLPTVNLQKFTNGCNDPTVHVYVLVYLGVRQTRIRDLTHTYVLVHLPTRSHMIISQALFFEV